MREFKVFYSWESDLPRKTNWNIIEKSINVAVENCNKIINGIEIKADRDTKGLTGSPNIETAIFTKINDCDLFIADISLVGVLKDCYDNQPSERNNVAKTKDSGNLKHSEKNIDNNNKYSPNPNVLIELGYAASKIDWDRIICFFNTDYGDVKDLPFDIDHHRVTKYSCSETNEAQVINYLSKIISGTIVTLCSKGSGHQKGKSSHIIGTYNMVEKCIDSELIAYDLKSYSWIEEYCDEHKKKALDIIEKIRSIHLAKREKKEKTAMFTSGSPNDEMFLKLFEMQNFNQDNSEQYLEYEISEEMRDTIITLSTRYLGINGNVFDDNFFCLGNMLEESWSPHILLYTGERVLGKRGTNEEREKDKLISELYEELQKIRHMKLYVKTFDDILLFPLAIENNSLEMDQVIDVTVYIEGKHILITPNIEFINPELRNEVVEIYKEELPKNLLVMLNNSDIRYDNPEYMLYDPGEPFYGRDKYSNLLSINDEEYENAIQAYIETPISKDSYLFHIQDLRASERKWLGGMIAIKKCGDVSHIKMKYKILSNNTSGDIEGELIYNGKIRG